MTINFSKEESDSFIIRKFTTNSNFSQLVDTLLVKRDVNSSYTEQGVDSFYIQMGYLLPSRYDYKIFFPATNTTRNISEIVQTEKDQRVCGTINNDPCSNDIISNKVDGVAASKSYATIKK